MAGVVRIRSSLRGVEGDERMSQDDAVEASGIVLEELSSWPEEMCRRELPSVLPRLLISLEGAEGGVSRACSWVGSQTRAAWDSNRVFRGDGGGSEDNRGLRGRRAWHCGAPTPLFLRTLSLFLSSLPPPNPPGRACLNVGDANAGWCLVSR